MITVRRGTAADLPQIMEIARQAATAAQWNPKQYKNLLAADSHREFLVVAEDNKIHGFIVGRQASREWEIENIVVDAAARRRELGSQLLREFIDHVRARGGSEIHLEVRESNLPARKLYEKWGFIASGRRKAYYQDPPEDALLLRFSFPQYG